MLALLLLASTVPASYYGQAKVDIIEVNHFGDEHQSHQVILWKWSAKDAQHHVVAWQWHDGRPITKSGGYYHYAWRGPAQRVVKARSFRQTWTRHDRERADAAITHESRRTPLWRSK